MPGKLAFLDCSSYSRNMGSKQLGLSLVEIYPFDSYFTYFICRVSLLGHSLETFPEEMKAVRDAGHEL